MARGVAHGQQWDVRRGVMTQGSQSSTYRAWGGTLRAKARRQLHETSTAEPSGTGPLHTRRGQAEDQAKAAWQTRARAIGGGSAARCRCRRVFRLAWPCVMAAMRRRNPCGHHGQRAMARAYFVELANDIASKKNRKINPIIKSSLNTNATRNIIDGRYSVYVSGRVDYK